jgi:hypothetical protein
MVLNSYIFFSEKGYVQFTIREKFRPELKYKSSAAYKILSGNVREDVSEVKFSNKKKVLKRFILTSPLSCSFCIARETSDYLIHKYYLSRRLRERLRRLELSETCYSGIKLFGSKTNITQQQKFCDMQ